MVPGTVFVCEWNEYRVDKTVVIFVRKELNSKSDTQRGIYLIHFGIRESAYKIGQQRFWNADKIIAIYCAVVLKTFIDAYFYLCWYTFIITENRSANYSGKVGFNYQLSGNNKINTIIFWVIFISPVDSIEPSVRKFTALHSLSSHERNALRFWKIVSQTAFAQTAAGAGVPAAINFTVQ